MSETDDEFEQQEDASPDEIIHQLFARTGIAVDASDPILVQAELGKIQLASQHNENERHSRALGRAIEEILKQHLGGISEDGLSQNAKKIGNHTASLQKAMRGHMIFQTVLTAMNFIAVAIMGIITWYLVSL